MPLPRSGTIWLGNVREFQNVLEQAQRMQEQLFAAQQELADTEVQGTAGGGLVTVTATGQGEVVGLVIDAKAIDPEDPETLADLVLAAIRAASDAAQELQQEKMGPLAEGLGGGGLPGLPGLPGF